mgnify:CR=1 FL=1
MISTGLERAFAEAGDVCYDTNATTAEQEDAVLRIQHYADFSRDREVRKAAALWLIERQFFLSPFDTGALVADE